MSSKTVSDEYIRGMNAATAEAQSCSDLEIAAQIASFLDDPPDTDFQHGYLAALKQAFVAKQAESK